MHGKNVAKENMVYRVDHDAHGLHFNDTYYCVLHSKDNVITVLDTRGRQVRKIFKKDMFGKKIELGWDIHMDKTTHNIYLPCKGENKGVLSVTLTGDTLWFTPLPRQLKGITEINDFLCVTGSDEKCIHLISKSGDYKGKLLDKGDIIEKPGYIFYDRSSKKLWFDACSKGTFCFVSVNSESQSCCPIMWIYSINYCQPWDSIPGEIRSTDLY